jgi:hypothetical protein
MEQPQCPRARGFQGSPRVPSGLAACRRSRRRRMPACLGGSIVHDGPIASGPCSRSVSQGRPDLAHWVEHGRLASPGMRCERRRASRPRSCDRYRGASHRPGSSGRLNQPDGPSPVREQSPTDDVGRGRPPGAVPAARTVRWRVVCLPDGRMGRSAGECRFEAVDTETRSGPDRNNGGKGLTVPHVMRTLLLTAALICGT